MRKYAVNRAGMAAQIIPEAKPPRIIVIMSSGRGQSQHEPDRGGSYRTHVELTFATDIPGPHPEGEASAQTCEQHRRGVYEGGAEGTIRSNRGRVHLMVGRERVMSCGRQQDADDDRRQEDRRKWDGYLEPLRSVQPTFDAERAGDVAPAIMRPICCLLASAAATTPSTRPL